jgi:hypothetical protein
VGKGPSDTTGYYQGPSPTSGGYVIYLNKEGAPGGLSYHSAANDTQLMAFTNNLAGQSYTTVNECLVYYASQSDKVVLNRDYEGIVTDGLVLNLDAGFTPSYPRSGTTWSDVSLSGNNGTLTNGPTFNSDNGGSIVLDGVDDLINFTSLPSFNSVVSVEAWIYILGDHGGSGNAGTILFHSGRYFQYRNDKRIASYWDGGYYFTPYNSINYNQWHNIFQVWDSPNATLKVYIDSVLSLTTSISTSNKTSGTTGQIGMQGTNPSGLYSRIFNGKIASVKLYNKALTSEEIQQNYNAQKSRFGL